MDHNDLWKETIVGSVISQATFSNCTIVPSTRTLSTISERESRQDLSLPFNENEGKEDTYRNTERLKNTSLPTSQKLSHNCSHCSFKSNKSISAFYGNKESRDRMEDEINKEDIYSQICKDMNNASVAPFIELGAVHKILDFIADSDSKVFSLTNNYCNEIFRTLKYLLTQHHKKLDNLLSNDSSLHKCEHCGVISCMLESHSVIEKIKKIQAKHNVEATVAERDCINNDQNNEKLEILTNPSNLMNNVQSINDFKMNNRIEYTDELSEMELLPTKERASVMKRYNESSNEANNISKTNINATIENKRYLSNNADVYKLFTDLEIERKNKRYDCNTARNNPDEYKSSNAIKAYALPIDTEEVVKEISYEPKSQTDNLLARDRCSIAQNIQASQQPRQLFDKHDDIYPVIDTVKYLARGQFMELDKKENELLSKLQERHYTRTDNVRNERSSVLYGSREDYSQRDAGFWLFDESGHLPPIEEYHYLQMPRIDSSDRKNVSFPANASRYSHTIEKVKTDSRSKMEKDSLENCTLLEQRRESNATIFSTSSVENLIYGSLNKKYEINNVDNEDIPRGRQLVSSKPSLDIARHVRAQIAKDRHSGNAKESISEQHTHDSNILVGLSPETRRKICHLIETIVSSDKDLTFFRKKYLINNALNSEKLLHCKSADAAFAHSNKTNNEIINIDANDCIPTKLSDLSEDRNRLFKRQDNFVHVCNQNLNKSKDSIRIRHENITSVSADKPTKKIRRQIICKDSLLKNNGNSDGYMMAEILPIYHKILEDSRNMDWENFREFVEVLHPDEKKLWRDVCKIISEEAKRISDDTEICIEISPVNPEEPLKIGKIMTCAQEIVFELDMTLKDVGNFFNKIFAEDHLNTHKGEDVTGWGSNGRWERILK